MKAILLAAGRGERMKPLTTQTPKPLMRVGDTTLIEHALLALKKAGVRDVVINVHHLGDQIMQYCGDGDRYGLSIHYSIEETLLETGGGIFNALPMLGRDPFLVLSADVWCDYPLANLIKKPINAAHLVLVNNPDFHPKGDFGLDSNGIVHNAAEEQFTYANIAVVDPALFSAEKAGVFPLSRVLRAAIEKKIVTGERYGGEWYNVGTVDELEALRRKCR